MANDEFSIPKEIGGLRRHHCKIELLYASRSDSKDSVLIVLLDFS